MDSDKIIGLARLRPVQPTDIARQFGVDLIVAGAYLSTLSSKKLLRITNLKSGSSPFYFYPGNEAQLLDYSKYLNEKDRITFDLLKEKKVLRPSEESPLIRVSLANIKDFAIPLEASHNNSKEIFYKWFLLKDDEAIDIIKKMVDKKELAVKKEISVEDIKPELKTEQIKKKIKKPQISQSNNSDFISFFKENNIEIIQILNKKQKDVEKIIKLPTKLGLVKFYCRILTKAKVSDSDISKTMINAQLRKLPALLLYSGDLTVKAEELSKKVDDILIKRF